jgi:hypothetical protein
MADIRRSDAPRRAIFTVKLTEQEAADLKRLAEKNHRRPGDHLRHLLAKAVEWDRDKLGAAADAATAAERREHDPAVP